MDSRYSPAAAPLATRAQLERISEPWALTRFFAIVVTLVLAMLLGTWAASGEMENIILLAVWLAAIMVIVFVRDQWWAPALVITALCFRTTAMGFSLSGIDIGMVILALTFPIKMAMKTLRKAEPEMDAGLLYWLLLGFVATHAVVIICYSRIEAEQIKNVVKAYYEALSPLVYYGLLVRYCATRTVKPAVYCMFAATFFSVCAAVVTLHLGLNLQVFSELRISVDWLGADGSSGLLRTLGPILFIACLSFWPAIRPGPGRFVLVAGICISAYGVMLSGGRVPFAILIAAGAFFAVARRKIWMFTPVIVLTTLISAVTSVQPDILLALPDTMQRALAPLNFSDKKTEAQASVEISDDFHRELRVESIDYWTQDTGSFWIGHGYKPWDESLSNIADNAEAEDYYRSKRVAIEMGLTENMFSSITNIFGLTGLTLYGLYLLNLAWRLWKAIRLCPERSTARALCEFSFVSLCAALITCSLAGGTPNMYLMYWQLGLLAARPYIVRGSVRQPKPETAIPSFIPKGIRPAV